MSHAPTAEQAHIIELFRTGKPLRVRAGAGTGKTTTLQMLAGELEKEHRIGLYIAFNKSVAVEAGRKFPRNITAKTAHALAFAGIRNTRYADLLRKMQGNTRIPFSTTQQRLSIDGFSVRGSDGSWRNITPFNVTRTVIRTLDEFCKTTDEAIGPQHVPVMLGLEPSHQNVVDAILPYARAAWKDLLHPNGDAIPFGHGHYLKLWALEHPRIGHEGAALFVDEAQDTSAVLNGVIAEQTHLHRVYVGDSSQAIYRFTGAVDAMSKFEGSIEGRLTQSWRFGQEVANAANELLTKLGDDMRLTGNPGLNSVIDRRATDYTAILTRTNGRALEHVMASQRAGKRVHLMGDHKYALSFIDGAEKLMDGRRAGNEDLSAFTTWEQVVEHADESPDAADWKVLVKLIEAHGCDDLRDALGGSVSEAQADIVVATAHKSKGREFTRVKLDNDLNEAIGMAKESGDSGKLRDELMLGYVAATRAQHLLNPGQLTRTPDTAMLAGVA